MDSSSSHSCSNIIAFPNSQKTRTRSILNQLLKRAIERPKVGCSRIAAVLVYKNQFFYGGNSYKSHPFQAKYSKNPDSIYLHAEVDAINKARKVLSPLEMRKATLYIARVKGRPTVDQDCDTLLWGLAKPCKGCQRAIYMEGVGRVIFTTDETGVWEEWETNFDERLAA